MTREMSGFLKQPQRCSLHDTSPYLYPPTQCQYVYTSGKPTPKGKLPIGSFAGNVQISKKNINSLKGSNLASPLTVPFFFRVIFSEPRRVASRVGRTGYWGTGTFVEGCLGNSLAVGGFWGRKSGLGIFVD